MHPAGEARAGVSGRLRLAAEDSDVLPAVGDWVALQLHTAGDAVIRNVLPRRNALYRRDSGGRKKRTGGTGADQAIAANVDVVFVVCGLDRDFNLRRIERYITLAYSCGIQPAVVLTKADLCRDAEAREAQTIAVAPGVAVRAVNSFAEGGVGWVRAQIGAGQTACLLGSSGAGKSTLINRLLGRDRMRTRQTSGTTGKGQHTTTHRELLLVDGGGVVIDNPGLREIGLAGAEDGLSDSFEEIDRLAEDCRFRDCSHDNEPGCAVRAAVEGGRLPPERLDSFHRLGRELHYRAISQDKGAASAERAKWKPIMKSLRRIQKD
jgi:ribosome biogenesis GTPase